MGKNSRQEALAEIIGSRKVRTQEELVRALAEKQITVTQATLSRDLKEISAVKVTDPREGFYYRIQKKPAERSRLPIDSIDISGQMCVLHCQPGLASAVASVVDKSQIEGVMGTVAGDDTVFVALRENVDRKRLETALKAIFNIIDITVRVATADDTRYAPEICNEIYISSLERKTGIATRTEDYVNSKILGGKSVIAVTDDGQFAGFSYIESWGGKSFVANSGLIVAHKFRGLGLSRRIKEQTFILSRTLFPDAKIFSITTGAAVMKMNYEFGFRPVPFAQLTDDPEFWKGCEGCRNVDVLKRNDYQMCICTGLLYDPKEHLQIHHPDE